MGLFERLFHSKKAVESVENKELPKKKESGEWKAIPGYIPANKSEYQVVAPIATAIAAGDQPESTFIVKHIAKRNPEAQLVAVIVSSIVAADRPESQFVIKSIKEKNT